MPKTLSHMPAIIFLVLSFFAAAILYAIVFLEIKEGGRDMTFAIFGTVLTLWGNSIAYWINTTRSSAIKTDIIAQSEPVRTE